MASMASTANVDSDLLSRFSYLAIVPRGFQDDISSILKSKTKALRASSGNNPKINDDREGNQQHGNDGRRYYNQHEEDRLLKISVWNDVEDKEILHEAIQALQLQKEEKEKRRKHRMEQENSDSNNNANKQQKLQRNESDEKNNGESSPSWIPPQCTVGSVWHPSSRRHISVGYYDQQIQRDHHDHDDRDEVAKSSSPSSHSPSPRCTLSYQSNWSCTGQLPGSVWMQLETNSKQISQQIIATSKCLGPLLALISVQTDNRCLQGAISPPHSLNEMTDEIGRHVSGPNFSKRLNNAILVWKDCVRVTWKDRLSTEDYDQLENRIQSNRLRFRLSCVREEPNSKLSAKRKGKAAPTSDFFTYTRQELCRAVMDACGKHLVPDFYNSDDGKTRNGAKEGAGIWSVNLELFDVEFVIIILPGKDAFGISLCPYSFLRSKSFACSSHIPPDVSMPFLGGGDLSKGIVRLRPTNTHILLNIAHLQPGDIVLDPCAGIGTIPLLAEQYGYQCVGLGGDLVLNNPKFSHVAGLIESLGKSTRSSNNPNNGATTSNLLTGWDAAHLPVRTQSVDVIVSDLPFGQQCLSLNTLKQLLPLIFRECARVLMPTRGRMVLLCGGSPSTLFPLLDQLSGNYWQKPALRVSPVTIGGLLAWVIKIYRNDVAFCNDDDNEQHQNNIKTILDRVRKIASKRDRISRQRKSEVIEQQAGKRRRANNPNQEVHHESNLQAAKKAVIVKSSNTNIE